MNFYFNLLIFHNIVFLSLPKLESNNSSRWKRSLLKMHEMFDKCLISSIIWVPESLMAVLACVSDWRMAPRLCSRLHIKDTVTSLRNCSSSPLHLAFWRYERHHLSSGKKWFSFNRTCFLPNPLGLQANVCTLHMNCVCFIV